MATVIKLGDEHSYAVSEDVEQVEAALRVGARKTPPLARLTQARSKKPLVVNVNLVGSFYERTRSSSSGTRKAAKDSESA